MRTAHSSSRPGGLHQPPHREQALPRDQTPESGWIPKARVNTWYST